MDQAPVQAVQVISRRCHCAQLEAPIRASGSGRCIFCDKHREQKMRLQLVGKFNASVQTTMFGASICNACFVKTWCRLLRCFEGCNLLTRAQWAFGLDVVS